VSFTVSYEQKHIYLWLFNDAVSSSEHTVSNERMLKEMVLINSENGHEETLTKTAGFWANS
jgi:hypothetical protein